MVAAWQLWAAVWLGIISFIAADNVTTETTEQDNVTNESNTTMTVTSTNTTMSSTMSSTTTTTSFITSSTVTATPISFTATRTATSEMLTTTFSTGTNTTATTTATTASMTSTTRSTTTTSSTIVARPYNFAAVREAVPWCAPEVLNAIHNDIFIEVTRYALIGQNLDCKDGTALFIFEALNRCPEDVVDEVVKSYKSSSPRLYAQNASGITPLLASAARGFTRVARRLIAVGANYSVVDSSGRTVLHHAAVWPDTVRGIVAKMYSEDARLQLAWPDVDGNLPFHLALKAGVTEAAEAMLNKAQQLSGALPVLLASSANLAGESAAHLTADLQMLQQLIVFKANLSARTVVGATPMHTVAGIPGSVAAGTLQLLAKESGISVLDTDFRGRTVLHYAAECGDAETVTWLFSQGANPRLRDRDGKLPLQLGLGHRHYHLVPIFEQNNGFPLQAAVGLGEVSVVKHLVLNQSVAADGIDSLSGRSALFESAEQGMADVAAFLISQRASVIRTDDAGLSVLGAAAAASQADMVEYLLGQGAPAMQRLQNFSTALHLAASAGSEATIQILIAARADVQAKDFKNRTPLHFASTREATAALLMAGATATRSSDFGLVPLHLAALQSRTSALEVLLASRTSQVNERDFAGNTALHYACTAGSEEAVRLLLRWCADSQVANDDGMLPQQLARKASLKAVAGGDVAVSHRCECDCGAYEPGALYLTADWKANCNATVRCRFGGSDGSASEEDVLCTRNVSAILTFAGTTPGRTTGVWAPERPTLRCRSPVASEAPPQRNVFFAVSIALLVVSHVVRTS